MDPAETERHPVPLIVTPLYIEFEANKTRLMDHVSDGEATYRVSAASILGTTSSAEAGRDRGLGKALELQVDRLEQGDLLMITLSARHHLARPMGHTGECFFLDSDDTEPGQVQVTPEQTSRYRTLNTWIDAELDLRSTVARHQNTYWEPITPGPLVPTALNLSVLTPASPASVEWIRREEPDTPTIDANIRSLAGQSPFDYLVGWTMVEDIYEPEASVVKEESLKEVQRVLEAYASGHMRLPADPEAADDWTLRFDRLASAFNELSRFRSDTFSSQHRALTRRIANEARYPARMVLRGLRANEDLWSTRAPTDMFASDRKSLQLVHCPKYQIGVLSMTVSSEHSHAFEWSVLGDERPARHEASAG